MKLKIAITAFFAILIVLSIFSVYGEDSTAPIPNLNQEIKSIEESEASLSIPFIVSLIALAINLGLLGFLIIKKKHKIDGKDEELRKKLEEKEKEYQDFKKKVKLEAENYERRKKTEIKQSNQDLLRKILPILDEFELEFKHKKEDTSFTEGMETTFSKLYKTLEKEGLKKIDCVGRQFDSNFHEIISYEESGKEEGTILEEFQKGYILNEKVIRPAKVKVSKGVAK